MTIRTPFLVAASVLLMSPVAQCRLGGQRRHDHHLGPGAPMVFMRAVKAANQLRYAGERVVEFQRGPMRRSHTEYVLKDGPNIRTTFPGDSEFAGQIIVETAQERLHYFPARNEIEVTPPRREEAFMRLRGWLKEADKIRLSQAPGEPVAGRPTELGIVSDQNGNVLQRLWVDQQTGMVLKRELLDPVGARIGFFQYTNIDYNPSILPTDFKINRNGAVRVTLEEKANRLAKKQGMMAVNIPQTSGFRLDGVNVMHPAGAKVFHQEYVGSHGRLSLFQVAGVYDLSSFRRHGQHDVQFYGWQMGGHSFALVGNYPISQLQQIARTLGDRGNVPQG